MHINITWQDVNTVLLGMDDTLLDPTFGDYFWQKLVSGTYGAKQDVSPQETQDYTRRQYHAVQHTLSWYCLDYWSECLNLDICTMTTGRGLRAVLRKDIVPFLDALKASDEHHTLLTNTHPYNLAVKLEHTDLASHLDLLLSTHTFGYLKENQRLWHTVAGETGMSAEKTLFIDNSKSILDAAALYSIRYYLDATNPDSGIAGKQHARRPSLNDYRRLIPPLM